MGCVNSINDIFDECISIGRNNWQVWGSGKPGCDVYKLVSIWNYSIIGEEVFMEQEVNAINKEVNIEELLPIVSAKNKNFIVKNKVKDEYSERLKDKLKATQVKKTKKKKRTAKNSNQTTLLNNAMLNSNLSTVINVLECVTLYCQDNCAYEILCLPYSPRYLFFMVGGDMFLQSLGEATSSTALFPIIAVKNMR